MAKIIIVQNINNQNINVDGREHKQLKLAVKQVI